MEIIPAIDIIDGKCVRLSEGDFAQKTVYDKNPLEAATQFEQAGLTRLHIVDLDGARSGQIKNLGVLKNIVAKTSLIIDFGGGIRTNSDVQSVFDAGASMLSVGSIAVNETDTFVGWLNTFGPERFILGADVRGTKLSINGWQSSTDVDVIPFLAAHFNRGVKQGFVTDIRSDGRLKGPSFELYKSIRKELPDLKLIASGGVTTMEDIRRLDQIGCSGVIIGKAIYEGTIKLRELSDYVG